MVFLIFFLNSVKRQIYPSRIILEITQTSPKQVTEENNLPSEILIGIVLTD